MMGLFETWAEVVELEGPAPWGGGEIAFLKRNRIAPRLSYLECYRRGFFYVKRRAAGQRGSGVALTNNITNFVQHVETRMRRITGLPVCGPCLLNSLCQSKP
jgi:hypothetical protein